MKKIIQLFVACFFIGIGVASAQCGGCTLKCGAEEKAACVSSDEQTDVCVYYFHATRRCATCQAVEKVTKETLKKHFGDKVKFVSIDREVGKSNPLIKKHKVSGQTLLVVGNGKSVNLTNVAFMNARTKPQRLSEKLKKTIDSLM